MPIVLRVPGLVPDDPEDIVNSAWFLLRRAARWIDDPEVEPGSTLYLHSAAVNAICAETHIDDVHTFLYSSREEAAYELTGFFGNTITSDHALVRTGPPSGKGIALTVRDAQPLWLPKPIGVCVFGSFANYTDSGIKGWATTRGQPDEIDLHLGHREVSDRWATRVDIHGPIARSERADDWL